MPRIDWKRLPLKVRNHMHERLRERAISEDDIVKLMNWISTSPEVPEGAWCKDFGTFKLVSHGASPNTLLEKDQPCFGIRI